MNRKKTTMYLVRHGETEWNQQQRILGQSESVLSQKGLAQAKKLRNTLKNIPYTTIFSSDLKRAIDTAHILAAQKGLSIQTTALLRERKMGTWEGVHIDKLLEDNKRLKKAYAVLNDKQKWQFKREKDMESQEEICNRLLRFLRNIAKTYSGARSGKASARASRRHRIKVRASKAALCGGVYRTQAGSLSSQQARDGNQANESGRKNATH